MHRIKVVTAFYKLWYRCSWADCFREILEEDSNFSMSISVSDSVVPLILNRTRTDEIAGQQVFDGLYGYCDALKQRVCHLMLLAKSMTGEEVAPSNVLYTDYTCRARNCLIFRSGCYARASYIERYRSDNGHGSMFLTHY